MKILYCYIQIYINKYLSIKAGSTGKNFNYPNNIISLISIWSIFNKKIENSISKLRSLILLEKLIKKIGFVNEIKKYIIPTILNWILENINTEDNLINLTLHYGAEMLYYWLKNINSQEIYLFFKENSEKLLFIEPLFYKNKYYIHKNEQKEIENYLEKCEILIRYLYFENDVSEWIFYELENSIKKIENEKIINLFKNIKEENTDNKSIYLEIYKIIIKINYENEETFLKNLFENCQILNFNNEMMIFLNNFLKENKEKKIIFILEFLYEILSNELINENISKNKFLALKTIQILFEKEKKYVFYLINPFLKFYEEISLNKLLKKGKINKSLLILALESILIWGNLYPDSFYGNFLNQLIEKKIKFPENLNYFHKIQINVSKSKYFEDKINCFMNEIYKIYNNNSLIIKFIDENKEFLTEINNIFIKKGGDISLNSYRNLYIFREIILLDSNYFRKIQILLYSKPYIIHFSPPIKVDEILLSNFYEKIIKKSGYFQKYSCYYENAIINDDDYEILDIIFVIFHRLCNENGYCNEKNKILIMLKNIFLQRKLILMNKISLYIIPHLIKELLFFEKNAILVDIFEAKDFFLIVSEFIIEIFQENQRFNFIDNDTLEKIKIIFKEKEIKLKINCLNSENKKFFYHKDSVFLNKKLLKQPSNLSNNTDFYKKFDDLWSNSRKMHISLKNFESISKDKSKIKMNDLYQDINLKSKEIFNFNTDKSHNILNNNFIQEILLDEKKILPLKKIN